MRCQTTVLDDSEVLRLARRWDPAATALQRMHGGENITWRVRSPNGDSALRLTHRSRRTIAELRGELAFVHHLHAGGLRVARFRRLHSGDRVAVLEEGAASGWAATCSEWLPGRRFDYFSPDVDARLFRVWGSTMAAMHELSRGFVLPPGAERSDWFADRVAGCTLDGSPLDRRILGRRDDIIAWLRDTPAEPDQYGLVHGDLERTNFLLDDVGISVIDFDDCCRHWFAWDIACALWAFRGAPRSDRARYLEWFMQGYSSVRDPDEPRMRRFADLVRLRSIALLLHLRRSRFHRSPPLDPGWIASTERWICSDWQW